jgi:hypothetical protein
MKNRYQKTSFYKREWKDTVATGLWSAPKAFMSVIWHDFFMVQ